MKALLDRSVACMWPDRQQETTPAVLQLQDAAIQDSPTLEPAAQCLTRQALEIVLQHQPSAAHLQSLCTLLQVGKAWKAALLEAAAGKADVCISIRSVDQLSRVASLAAWLQKYGACVRSLIIFCHLGWTPDQCEMSTRLEAQYKAVSHIAAILEGGVLNHNTVSLAPWSSLRTLNISLPVDGSLFAVLPTSLTQLSITTKAHSTDFAALAKLQNLRSLYVRSEAGTSRVPQSCYQELPGLTVLTSLGVEHPTNHNDWRQVPVQVQRLSVGDSCLWETAGEMQVQLEHVVGLTKIILMCNGILRGCQLPASLRDLQFVCRTDIPTCKVMVSLGISGLTALTRLWLGKITGDGDALGPLASLTQLQKVQLSWAGEPHDLKSVASALRDVPGVLSLHASTHTSSLHESEHLMQQLGALTRLTDLLLSIQMNVAHEQGALGAAAAEPVATCRHLSTLTGLQKLTLVANRSFLKRDVRHLTALRSLTYLSLYPRSPNADYFSLPLPFVH